MKMHDRSLFAVLLRSAWWVSLLVAAVTAALARWILEKFDLHPLYAIFVAAPFLVISGVAFWRQMRVPSARHIAATLEGLRALPAEDFAARLEAAYRRDGYDVKRITGAADFELEKSGRMTLVAFKRWKAVRTGIEPLRELDALRQKRDAASAIYIAAGEVTGTARSFATANNIRLLQPGELAALLPR
jgi:restriction system protein